MSPRTPSSGVLPGILLWVALVVVGSVATWAVIDAAGQQVLAGRETPVVTRPSGAPLPTAPATTGASTPVRPTTSPTHRGHPHHHRPTRAPSPSALPSASAPGPGGTSASPPAPTRSSTAPAPQHHGSGSSSGPAPSTPSSSSTSAGPRTVTRTWQGAAGRVAVSCTGRSARLASATPADGYSVEIGSRGPEEVEVTFTSGERETQVKAQCSGGVPRFEVETDSGSGGDDAAGGTDDRRGARVDD